MPTIHRALYRLAILLNREDPRVSRVVITLAFALLGLAIVLPALVEALS